MNSNRNLQKLLRIIFPEVLMEYFEISGWYDGSAKIEVWLDEKKYLEFSDYKSGTVISHGFTDEAVSKFNNDTVSFFMFFRKVE